MVSPPSKGCLGPLLGRPQKVEPAEDAAEAEAQFGGRES